MTAAKMTDGGTNEAAPGPTEGNEMRIRGVPERPVAGMSGASRRRRDAVRVVLTTLVLSLLAGPGLAQPLDGWHGAATVTSRGAGPPDHAPAPGWRGKPPPPPQAPFQVGAAAVNANPHSFDGICLGGYGAFCTRPMDSVRHDLYARALAVTGDSGDGETFVLVTTTAVGLFTAYKSHLGEVGTQAVREAVEARTGIPATNVMVQSDHSHAAPDSIGIWGGMPRAYFEQLRDAAIESAVAAIDGRQPAHLSVATVDGPPLRTLYDGPPTDRADTDFRVLFADDPDGERIATFVNYSPHATVLGNTRGAASGDWPAIASEIAEDRWAGSTGIATIGAIGATDFEVRGSGVKSEEEARSRIHQLLDQAEAQAAPVLGSDVAVETVFIREPLAQPFLAANLLPGIPGGGLAGEGSVAMERAITPPWLSGTVLGTVVGAARIGDVFLWGVPGEAFPHLQFRLQEGVDARAHFVVGAAYDFLGYMTDRLDAYQQAFEAGTVFYLAGCPDRELRSLLPGVEDGCNDHWTLMVSPTIGSHVVCSVQDAAARLGFDVDPGTRDRLCPLLTATDLPEPIVHGTG